MIFSSPSHIESQLGLFQCSNTEKSSLSRIEQVVVFDFGVLVGIPIILKEMLKG